MAHSSLEKVTNRTRGSLLALLVIAASAIMRFFGSSGFGNR